MYNYNLPLWLLEPGIAAAFVFSVPPSVGFFVVVVSVVPLAGNSCHRPVVDPPFSGRPLELKRPWLQFE